MATEKEKMLRGELYDASDPVLSGDRMRARELARAFSTSRADEVARRREILAELLGSGGDTAWIEPPFYCDYGYNILLGEKVYFNYNCILLDVMQVEIGSFTMFGPAVQIYTATHPVDYQERRSGLEFARPVKIGEDVWVGGGAMILPGVTIGPRSVIGAGSVVTRNIPAGVFAAGNPCRVVRALESPQGYV